MALAARHAASALSLATAEGHVCIGLQALTALPDAPADAAAWRQALRASGVVGTPDEPGSMPLILDDEDRLYLHRYLDCERRFARRLMRAQGSAPRLAADFTALQQRLQALFAANANAGATEGASEGATGDASDGAIEGVGDGVSERASECAGWQ